MKKTPAKIFFLLALAVLLNGESNFLNIRGNYYFSFNVGSQSYIRSIEVESNSAGEEICKVNVDLCNSKNIDFLGYADGSKYSFENKKTLFRYDLIYGFQEKNDGNFFEVGFYNNDKLQELFFSYAFVFDSLRYFNKNYPYFKISSAIGHTDSKTLAPTSYSYSGGLGSYYKLSQNYKLRIGFDYTIRDWLNIKKSYGNEVWSDKEFYIYTGIGYSY